LGIAESTLRGVISDDRHRCLYQVQRPVQSMNTGAVQMFDTGTVQRLDQLEVELYGLW
jgi:hypothetical protein